MTIKVNNFTKFLNSFTKTGRQANKEINDMCLLAHKDVIYQKRLQNGSIALLKKLEFSKFSEDTFCLIKPDGSKVVKTTHNVFSGENEKQKTHLVFTEFFNNAGTRMKLIKKAVLYRMPKCKIEEIAKKLTIWDGPSELTVCSKAGRISEFPVTKLAGSIHPNMATKKELPNGDVIYREYHPYSK